MNQDRATNHTKKQLVHLVYFPRSGSTFLASLLEMHPDISVSSESGFLKYLSQLSSNNIAKFNHVIEKLKQCDRGFSNLIQNDSFIRNYYKQRQNVDYYGVANAILSSHFGKKNTSKIWVVKSLKCGWDLPEIAEKMPQIKFIHIYRDGRAVLNSLLRTKKVYATGTMSEEPLTPSILWKRWMRYINRFNIDTSVKICNVQYERLLKNPEEQLARIFDFLGVPNIPVNESALSNYTKRIPSLESSLHPNVGKGPILEREFKWQSELSEPNIRLFEIVNGKILQKMGYSLLYHSIWKGLLSPSIMKTLFLSLFKIGWRQIKK